MRIAEEFRIENATGHALILQKMTDGITYIDFGMTHLPHDFQGYRVKYTDRTAEPQGDGTFKVSNSADSYHRV